MIRGTTPTLTFTIPFDSGIIQALYISFVQNGQEVLTLTEQDCTLDEKTVTVKLSQAQTLKLGSGRAVEIQMRVLTAEGDALASQILRCPVERILKDGEIA